MKLKKRSRNKIREVQKMIQELPVASAMLTYVRLYQALEELHFQGEYKLVDSLCDALLNK